MVKGGCGQSGDKTLKLTAILKNEQMEQTDFLHVDTDLEKFKVDQNNFGWAWSKMGGPSLVMGL